MSLKIKMVIIVAFLLGITGLVSAHFTVSYQKERLMSKFHKRHLGLAQSLAMSVFAPLAMGETETLQTIIGAAKKDSDVVEALVMNQDGKVLASTNPASVGRIMNDPFSKNILDSDEPVHRDFYEKKVPVSDLGLPVFAPGGDMKLGAVRIMMAPRSILEDFSRVQTAVLVATVVMILAFSCIFYWIMGGITRPIEEQKAILDNVAGGDLTNRVEIRRNDEIGMLGFSLNAMLSGLSTLIRKIFSVSDSVQVTAGQVSTNCEQSRTAMEQTASSMNELAENAKKQMTAVSFAVSRVESLSAEIRDLTGKIEIYQGTTNATIESGDAGKAAIERLADKVLAIQGAMGHAVPLLKTLAKQSQEIIRITDLFNDLASETRILSLHLRAESIRSKGKSGTAFTVLSREIGRLSREAKEKSDTISTALTQTLGVIGDTIQAVEKAVQDVSRGASLGENAKQVLQEISDAVRQCADEVSLIQVVSGELIKGNNMVTEKVAEVSRVSADNAKSADAVARESREQTVIFAGISDLASDLNKRISLLVEEISRFKVRPEDGQGFSVSNIVRDTTPLPTARA
ncbi:MAG: HAMP domain-containing protein [Armatimonadetes bacterium]|nr:HAMP domain-containing protein [Armatimonadota bacterium]